MQNKTPLNTIPVQQFIQVVKGAEASGAKEIKVNIQQAKTLAFTLGEIMARLNGDLEELLLNKTSNETEEIIEVRVDGGTNFN